MGTEIHRARMIEGGRIRFEVECDDLNHFAAVANAAMAVVPEAYRAPEPHVRMERDAYAARHAAAEQSTGRRIPRATVPPFVQTEDTVIGGNAYPPEEPEALTAGTAYQAHELKVGWTD